MMQQFRLLFSKKLFDFFHNRTVKSVNRLRHQNSAVVENNVRFLLFCLFTDKLYKSLLLHILVLITRLPKSFGIQQKKAGPSAWICTTSYLPNALQSAAKKEELTAASPPDVKIGTTIFSKKAKKISRIKFPIGLKPLGSPMRLIRTYFNY